MRAGLARFNLLSADHDKISGYDKTAKSGIRLSRGGLSAEQSVITRHVLYTCLQQARGNGVLHAFDQIVSE